jgi:hypothetical protein
MGSEPQSPALVPSGPAADGPGPSGTVQVLEAKLEGAMAALRIHAQRRNEERHRHQEEKAQLEAQISFLQERVVQAEQSDREMRLLMA